MIRAVQPTVDGIASLSTVWAVMQAARAGAADATSSAQGLLPALAQGVAGGLYTAGFALGFAVTFPAVLVAGVMPRRNPIYYGLADGGHAGLDLARSTVAPAPRVTLAVVES